MPFGASRGIDVDMPIACGVRGSRGGGCFSWTGACRLTYLMTTLQKIGRKKKIMKRNRPKFQLLFTDRIGIVFDITRLMTVKGLNIVAMEVEQEADWAKISIEMDSAGREMDPVELLRHFGELSGVREVRKIKALPQEKRELWFRTLFDGVSEGIISVDDTGRVNTINHVAARILKKDYEEIIGQRIGEVVSTDSVLEECLRKRIPIRRKRSVVTSGGRVEFYASARPINDAAGRFVGAVLMMRDLKEVREMVAAVAGPIQITFDDFLGESPVIRNVISFAKKIARTDAIASIRGQSGTGKELFASAIHFESGRGGPFVPINCAAMPESLLESELFGYADGAFTGARRSGKPGLFEVANNGTIFLDEIGDMPPGPQAKILRVLQEGLVRRIGGSEEVPVNTRIITATNKNLERMVQEKTFREDLYYRINVLPIHIPPLRERRGDIALLTAHLLHQFNLRLGKPDQTLSSAAMEKIMGHDWPGNVRELKNVTERAAILSDSEEIQMASILFSYETDTNPRAAEGVLTAAGSGKKLKTLVGEYEKEIIGRALERAPSIRKTAKSLGISHTALQNKIRKYGIDLSRG